MSKPQRTKNPKHDTYYTPHWATHALVDYLAEHRLIREDSLVYEPCAGDGHIVKALQSNGLQVTYSDIREEAQGPTFDYLNPNTHSTQYLDECDWVITNPPYQTEHAKAVDFVERTLRDNRRAAFLLRLSFLEPTQSGRDTLFQKFPPDYILVLPRVHYLGPSGGDSNSETSCWFIWTSNFDSGTHTSWLTQAEKDRLKGQSELSL